MAKSKTSYTDVWEIVRKIPKGKVATYGQIATICGLPGRARFVGYAMHHVPSGAPIPWQRVINSQGKISFPKGSASYNRQRQALEKEGIIFSREKIDLKRFGWKK